MKYVLYSPCTDFIFDMNDLYLSSQRTAVALTTRGPKPFLFDSEKEVHDFIRNNGYSVDYWRPMSLDEFEVLQVLVV